MYVTFDGLPRLHIEIEENPSDADLMTALLNAEEIADVVLPLDPRTGFPRFTISETCGEGETIHV